MVKNKFVLRHLIGTLFHMSFLLRNHHFVTCGTVCLPLKFDNFAQIIPWKASSGKGVLRSFREKPFKKTDAFYGLITYHRKENLLWPKKEMGNICLLE